MRRGGEDKNLVVVVEPADVGGQPDETQQPVLVPVEGSHLSEKEKKTLGEGLHGFPGPSC